MNLLALRGAGPLSRPLPGRAVRQRVLLAVAEAALRVGLLVLCSYQRLLWVAPTEG